MRALILAIVFGLTLIPALSARTFERFVDRPGNDFDYKDGLDAGACKNACYGKQGCAAWTHVKPGPAGVQSRCWLKNAIPPNRIYNSCCTSGKIDTPPNLPESTVEIGVDRPGNDIMRLPGLSEDECRIRCMGNAECKAWTFVGRDNVCFLKSYPGRPVRNRQTISGTKVGAIIGTFPPPPGFPQ